ncbi:hypothetical protein HK104_010676, partial [Borealophlyctis nickersoniae]
MRPTLALLTSLALTAPTYGTPLRRDNTPEFDYIVVGSGPGGGVLASRLALAGYQTLLIDAGPDYASLNTTVPGFSANAGEDPQIAWNYFVKQGEAEQGERQ